MNRWLVAFLTLLIVAACAEVPTVPPPGGEQSAALGIVVEVRVSGLATYRADAAYFVKRCPANEACDERLILSSYGKDGRIYLLNAEPGEYGAVAVAFESGMPGDKSLYFAYFPDALTKASVTPIKGKGLAYAGHYKLAASLGLCPDNAEPGQLKVAQMIEPDSPKCGFWQPLVHKLSKGDFVFIGGKAYAVGKQAFHYRGTHFEATNNATDAAEFFEQARADLSEAGWVIEK